MRHYDDWLKAYMQYTAGSESPDKFHFWTGVGMVAGALRRCVWFDMGYFTWTPNFYIIFVAPPGIVSKSTTADIGANLLKQVPGINFGPDAITWQRLISSFAQAAESVRIGGTEEDPEFLPMSAITLISSEFGTLLDPRDAGMVNWLISLWDARTGVMRKETKTQGNDLFENPWLNMIACTTPHWIADNFPRQMIGGGFTSRCVWVYGERKRGLVAYPARAIASYQAEMEEKLVEDLAAISELRGAFHITPDAVAWGEAWYERNYEVNIKKASDEAMQGYFARKQTHLHKLAMVLAAARSSDLVLDVEHLEMAEIILTGTEHDIPRVFSKIGLTTETDAIQSVIHITTRQGSVDPQELYRTRFYRVMGYDRYQEVVKSALRTGYIELKTVDDGQRLVVSERGEQHARTETAAAEEANRVVKHGGA